MPLEGRDRRDQATARAVAGVSSRPCQCASHRPRATRPSPRTARIETGSPSTRAPNPAAVSGLRARKTVTRVALARFYPAAYPRDVRLFFYMPFQHSESLVDQEMGCALFAAFDDEETMKHALEHRDVIARFGRFPHRNHVLGRASTEEELDYLKTANRYGQ